MISGRYATFTQSWSAEDARFTPLNSDRSSVTVRCDSTNIQHNTIGIVIKWEQIATS